MDLYHYYRYIERMELPRKGTPESFQKQHGVYFLVDAHYPMSKNYVPVIRKTAHTVQIVGPQCLRADVNKGEDNARFKAFFFTPICCLGPDECANPLNAKKTLFPDAATALKKFRPAWKARRAEIKVLANRAGEKLESAKRIPVLRDTTLCKRKPLQRETANGGPTEHAHRNSAGTATEHTSSNKQKGEYRRCLQIYVTT